MLLSSSHGYSKQRMLHYLDELESNRRIETSLYIPPDLPSVEIEKILDRTLNSPEIRADVIYEIERTTNGAVLYWGGGEGCLVIPPFPISDGVIYNRCDVEPLRFLLNREFVIALILIRLGAYAIGVFRGENLISSKVGTGHIHSRHKKGGSSQRRFERGREKQIEYFFERINTRVRERLETYFNELDYVVYGGERHILISFRKQCQYLKQFDDRVLNKLLNVHMPRQATLQSSISNVWTSYVIQWRNEE